jgi:O-antigen ligase
MRGSVQASPPTWAAALAVAALAIVALPPAPALRGSATASAIGVMAAWMVATNQWLNPSYTAAASFHAAFLVAGFLIGGRATATRSHAAMSAVLAFGACVATWALWQRLHGAPRATAMFETPATLSCVINLVLLPALAFTLFGTRRRLFAGIAILLAGALAAASSRGGWLGFCVGLLVMLFVARRAGLPMRAADFAVLVACIAAGAAIAEGAGLASQQWSSPGSPALAHSMLSEAAIQSSVDRLGMADLALRNLSPASLVSGIGYLGYYYVVQAGAHATPGFVPGTTFFVHNDYVQVLLELGLPGLILLLAMVLLPLLGAWSRSSMRADDRVLVVACAAALASMAAHATVDFPFYVPACLLLFGAMAGALDQAVDVERAPVARMGRLVVIAVATLVAWTLAMPLAADLAARRAHALWRAGDGGASYWFEMARSLEPRDWRYHWQAGQFWYAQAVQSRDARAARRAERAFAEGADANPRDVRNLTARITVHQVVGELLPDRASPETLRTWATRAAALAPADRAIRRQLDALP